MCKLNSHTKEKPRKYDLNDTKYQKPACLLGTKTYGSRLQCEICNKTYLSATSLANHLRRTNSFAKQTHKSGIWLKIFQHKKGKLLMK